MRDMMIKNGDIVIGSSGNTVLLEGTDAKISTGCALHLGKTRRIYL